MCSMEKIPVLAVIRAVTNIEPVILASLAQCPRCNHSHRELEVRQLQQPSPDHWDMWTMCPKTREPVLFRSLKSQDELFQRAHKDLPKEMVEKLHKAEDEVFALQEALFQSCQLPEPNHEVVHVNPSEEKS